MKRMYPLFRSLLCLPLFVAAWPMSPMAVHADPIILGSPLVDMHPENGQSCGRMLPLSDCAFSVQILTPSFATVSTTGGGIAQATAPQLVFQPANGFVGLEGAGGSVTTVGPGTASAHFGETILFNITNTSGSPGLMVFSDIVSADTTVNAHPFQGESMSYSMDVTVVGPGADSYILIGTHTCSPTFPDPTSCQNFIDHNTDEILANFDPGQTLSYDITEEINWSVSEVPEPSSFLLLLTMFGLASYVFLTVGLVLKTPRTRE
jgi:hypothetical protein